MVLVGSVNPKRGMTKLMTRYFIIFALHYFFILLYECYSSNRNSYEKHRYYVGHNSFRIQLLKSTVVDKIFNVSDKNKQIGLNNFSKGRVVSLVPVRIKSHIKALFKTNYLAQGPC